MKNIRKLKSRSKAAMIPAWRRRVVPVAEAMIALTLVDALMIQKATNL